MEIPPALTDWLTGLVVVVQALKLKLGIYQDDNYYAHIYCDNLPILICCLAGAAEVG